MPCLRLPLLLAFLSTSVAGAQEPDVILHNGKILTVDSAFSVRQAVAVRGDRIVALGADPEVLRLRGTGTKIVDLRGRTVIPGLIDSHVHPWDASVTEFDHPIPQMDTIRDVLDYVASRAKALKAGEWIHVRQVFITRLREQRYPTRAELDRAAPRNPVVFATGPDASLNSLALQRSGIDRNFKITDGGPGHIEKDPKTGEPTGILRSCTRLVKSDSPEKVPTDSERVQKFVQLLRDYNSVGITAIGDRDASEAEVARYKELEAAGRLSVRASVSQHVETLGPVEAIREEIRKIAANPLTRGSALLRLIGIKTYADGGMLTGSAYMREPWGKSRVYSIEDPSYRGVLFIPREKLLQIVRATVESGIQFTAHSQGDGAVHELLSVYEEVNRTLPIRKTRPAITHASFMTREAIEKIAELGVVVDLQPAWLYLDTRTLEGQFGYDRLRYFIPLRSLFAAGGIIGGGSDHMQKIGSLRSINPYNPFLGMWVSLTRKARWYGKELHSEEALTREQALRFYTSRNAYLVFREDQIGSLEPQKFADFVVLDRDFLTCPVDEVKDIQAVQTWFGGRLIFER